MDNNFKIPELAKGTTLPIMENIEMLEYRRMQEEIERKRQFRHDWMIATFSSVSGAVFGLITSVIFWLIEK